MNHKIFKVLIDDLTDAELETWLVSFLKSNRTNRIATPNAEMIIDSIKDDDFRSALQDTDLNLPDGVALRFAISALTDQKLKDRHTGVDTFQKLIELCAREGKSVLLFGGDKKVLKDVQGKINGNPLQLPLGKEEEFNQGPPTFQGGDRGGYQKGFRIEILDPGIVKIENGQVIIENSIVDRINKIGPDVIAIALTHKKQLLFMKQFKNQFPNIKIMIGIGGTLDMVSGKLRRAPKWMRKIGLEWFWRVLIEPSRIGRIAKASIVFPVIVIIESIRSKRLIKAIKQTVPEIIRQLVGK